MKLDKDKITAAIQQAELMTSGEIQVVVTKTKVKDVNVSARQTFERIGLGKTREKNAILFYIAEKSRQFAILGDSGIHAKVGQVFWETLKDSLTEAFRSGEFTAGLAGTIALCGEQLKNYFPRSADDVNELSNEVHIE